MRSQVAHRSLTVFVMLAVVAAVRAAEGAEPSALDYEAAAACPDREAFVSELRERTNEWNESPSATRKFTVRLTVTNTNRARASVVIDEAGRRGRPRVIGASSCAEAARALSFIVALTIDPDAKPPPDVAAAEDVPEPSDPSTAPLETKPDSSAATTPNASDARAGSSSSRSPSGVTFSAGITFEALGLAAPGPVIAGGIFGGVRPVPTLELRLSAHQSLPTDVRVNGTTTSILWTTGRLRACIDVLRGAYVFVGPCAHFEAGRLAAEGGGGNIRSERAQKLWTTVFAGARAELSLSQALGVELSAGALVPLDRIELTYRPAFVVYRPPAVVAAGAVAGFLRW